MASFEAMSSCLQTGHKLLSLDVANLSSYSAVFRDLDVVLILNADTGTSNSFFSPKNCVQENLLNLADIGQLVAKHCSPVRTKIVFTSSRAVYGEGNWHCELHGKQIVDRSASVLERGEFQPVCPVCAASMSLVPTDELSEHRYLSVYGMTKSAGERLLQLTLGNLGFDIRIVRFQNVFGAGQAIDNPYTGVLNWFSKQLVKNEDVSIYEKGLIIRDFIYVDDAATLLFALCEMEWDKRENPLILNGGSGIQTNLYDVAIKLKQYYRSSSQVVCSDKFRVGDVLGACADMTKSRTLLKFSTQISLDDGLSKYASWFAGEMTKAGIDG